MHPVAETDTAVLGALGPAVQRARSGIITMVDHGVVLPDQRLPGERALATQLGVSRTSVRAALAQLEKEGVLESSPWRGWYVRGERIVEGVRLRSFTEIVLSRGSVPTTRVLSRQIRQASHSELSSLGLGGSGRVLDLKRLRLIDDKPACIDRTVVALDRAPGLENVHLDNVSLYETLEDQCRVRIVRSDYSVQAAAASAEVAGYLGIRPGDPVLHGDETAYSADGVVTLLGDTLFRADSYRFDATLYRAARPEE